MDMLPAKSNSPLFSVLIANYNKGVYLDEAINSVLNQTYQNWELIIIDDASTDNSKQILSSFCVDSRIHVYYNGENRGCGYTKKKCVEKANGSICGFLDSDDVLVNTALETMVGYHLENTHHVLIYSQFFFADNTLKKARVNPRQCAIPEGESYLTSNLLGAVSHFATFKKSYYDKTEGIDSNLMAAVDIDLYLKLEEMGPITFVPIPLYYYRTDTGNNISLGETNNIIAIGYEIIARANACKRRNLPFNNYVFCNLENTINGIKENYYELGKTNISNTRANKLGKLILKPFKFFKSIIE